MKHSLLSERFKYKSDRIYPYRFGKEQIIFIEQVRDNIINKNYGLVYENCFCGESDGIVLAETDRYNLPVQSVICSTCGTIRITPYLNQHAVIDFYTFFYQKMYARSTNKADYFEKQSLYGKKIIEWIRANNVKVNTVLEIGCGAGGALNELTKSGINTTGCEFDEELISFAKSKGLDNIFYGSIEDIAVNLNDIKFDLIFSHHVLEHVNEVDLLFENCRNLLSDDGIIIHIVPDIFSLTTSHSNGGDLLTMIHLAHKYNFSEEGLRLLALKNGLHFRRVYPTENLTTHMSGSPEIWGEFRLQSTNVTASKKSSEILLQRLKQVESRFLRKQLQSRLKKFLKKVYRKILH